MQLVTAIMLTRGRAALAAIALECFLRQTYERKELVIVDDVLDPSFCQPPDGDNIVYLPSSLRSIADKRNLACALADGEYICHWDDDDWSAPERIADQVQRLESSFVSVTGYHSMLFHEAATGRAAKYLSDRHYALGTSLFYRRQWWETHKFQDPPETPNVGEDNAFVRQAREVGELISVDAGQIMVARAHIGNTSPKNMNDFNTVALSEIPSGFFQ